ncbi:HD-GYP domain-containing protein [Marinitoga sp. 38H-ov]|uniref:HD-GYP domain-containing protein n=1 Tax=Marinitoga sp. 38H-ov TaxID=1755814 RepID=UPI0013EDA482|nr:HD-GYP domain-containing protein [Marinitoga sp. 38H-ov]KAF2956781.1 hypothetical protein AS160_04240 [Marinitoga sp. 38H-ov]
MRLNEYVNKFIKKSLFLTIIIIFLITTIIITIDYYLNLRDIVNTQYHKINAILKNQKTRILYNSKLISKIYSYSVNDFEVIKNIVDENKLVVKIIDYKPTSNEINVSYPDNFLNLEIIKYIKENIENLKKEVSYYNFSDYIIFIVPYNYIVLDENIFGGFLLMYFKKDYLLDEVNIVLSKKEKIEKNINNILSVRKYFDFYNEDYYYVLSYRNDLFLYLILLIIMFSLSYIIYRILNRSIYVELKKDIIDEVEKFSNNVIDNNNIEVELNFKIEEINKLKDSYNILIDKLKKVINEKDLAYEELQASNEQLIETTNELENSIKNFDTFFNIVSDLVLKDADEKTFFDEILKKIIELIPNADYGSIILRDEGKWKYISAYGHDYNILKDINFDEKTFVYVDKTMEIDNIIEKDKLIFSEEEFNKIKQASKPFKRSILSPLKLNDYVIGQISLDSKEDISFSDESIKILDTYTMISSIFIRLKRSSKTEGQLHKNIILALIKALEYYDKYTRGHSERVADIVSEFCEFLGMSKSEIKKAYWAGITHDIGKFFIPQTILNKPGRLNDEEYELIKQHPIKSYELLASNPYLSEYSKIVRHHHERWDGKGYPDKLSKEEIPYISRIITLADSFDAMITIRPYKKAKSIEDIIEDIEKNAGTQFDPEFSVNFVEFLRRKYL